FTFTLTDAEGDVSPVVTVSIVVNNVNDAPVIELPEAATIDPQSQLLANIAVGGRTISSIAADGEWLAVAYKPDHVVEIYRLESGQYELEQTIPTGLNGGTDQLRLAMDDGTLVLGVAGATVGGFPRSGLVRVFELD